MKRVSVSHGPGFDPGYGLAGDMEKKRDPETASWVPNKNENTEEKTTIKDIVNEYGDTGTAHGIPRIITSVHWWAKIFWLIISCGLAAVFGIQGYGLLADFFSWPYNTKIDVISKSRVDFPAVTVCNMNRMRRSELVGTRFQGIIDVDGGFDLDSDYSWFWDFSSDFYEDWYSDWNWDPSAAPPGRKRRAGSSSAGPAPGSSLGPGGGGAPGSSLGPGGGGVPGSSLGPGGGGAPSSSLGPGGGGAPSSSFGPPGGGGAPSSSWGPGGGGAPSWGPGGGFGGGSGWASGFYSNFLSTPWWEASFYEFFDFDFDAYGSFQFEFDDYYNFDVDGESDWDGFYAQSKTDDYSDIADIANPTKEELRAYGHQAEDFILQCTFDKRGCNYTDFRQFQNNQYGNCYTFNHGFNNETVRATSKSGAQFGLHLTLFIEQPQYVGIFSPESGVRVSVHSADVQPSPQDVGITATTGMATSIGIRQSKIERLGGKYTKPYCTRDGSDTQYSHEEFAYSSLACRRFCLQEELKDRCDCVTDVVLDWQKCSYLNATQQRCRQLTESLYNDDKIECECPDACDEIIYPTSVSSALWPSEKYEQHLYNRISQVNPIAARTLEDVDTTRKNVVRLRIFFEELNYQLIEQQQAWSIEGISGAVGGLMGLYLGISAVSILEIFIFLVKLLVYICTCGHVCFQNKVHPESK